MNHLSVPPKGELKKQPESACRALVATSGPVAVDPFGGRVHVEWDPAAALTPLGQLPLFTEYLQVSGRFDPRVEQCPLHWTSPNAPRARDVLGTVVHPLRAPALCPHQRPARGHRQPPAAWHGEGRQRGCGAPGDEEARRGARVAWMQTHLDAVSAPLLGEPWILDSEVTVKPLYGHPEGAVVGYNPHTPGRPSHTYHTNFMANLRLVLDVEVQPGNRSASKYSSPGLWALLDRIGRAHWAVFIRGDRHWGSEGNRARAEQEGLPYLFKLRMTKRTKQLVERLLRDAAWTDAGQGWQGAESSLRLAGWDNARLLQGGFEEWKRKGGFDANRRGTGPVGH